jgi:dimethylargininase
MILEDKMLIAITRLVSPAISRCELTHLERVPIDLERARLQHHAYEETLSGLGVEVHSLHEEPQLPDSVFVEDTAIVLDECAVLTRPGADSRRPETESIARALAPYRKLFTVQPPGIVDGGDMLTVGKTIFVGLSSRSNQTAIDQIQGFLKPYGYNVKGIRVTGCLHLKSAVTQVKADTLLVNPAWVDKADLPGMKFIETDPSEQYAANALMVGETVLYQPAYPKTRARLEAAGIYSILVDESELGKAEGALTCCALIFKDFGET